MKIGRCQMQVCEDEYARALRSALEREPVPDERHIIEDDYLLTLLFEGALDQSEREQVLQHLAICRYCRCELLDLLKWRGLDQAKGSIWRQVWSRARKTIVPVAALVAAASVVIGVIWLWGLSGNSQQWRTIAMAREHLAAGQFSQAMQILEPLTKAPSPVSAEACRLMEEAAYQWARQSLTHKQFSDVFRAEEKLAGCSVKSARLRNLTLQAQSGLISEVTLDSFGTLVNLGYELDGQCLIKGLGPTAPHVQAMPELSPPKPETSDVLPAAPVPEPEPSGPTQPATSTAQETVPTPERELRLIPPLFPSPRVYEAYRRSLEEFPDDITLLLNFGWLCFQMGEFEQAEQAFQKVLALEPRNSRALVGLGLVAFSLAEEEKARQFFQQAVDADPNYQPAQINLAITLGALGRTDEARTIWQRLLQTQLDDRLRQQIELYLERTSERN